MKVYAMLQRLKKDGVVTGIQIVSTKDAPIVFFNIAECVARCGDQERIVEQMGLADGVSVECVPMEIGQTIETETI